MFGWKSDLSKAENILESFLVKNYSRDNFQHVTDLKYLFKKCQKYRHDGFNNIGNCQEMNVVRAIRSVPGLQDYLHNHQDHSEIINNFIDNNTIG